MLQYLKDTLNHTVILNEEWPENELANDQQAVRREARLYRNGQESVEPLTFAIR